MGILLALAIAVAIAVSLPAVARSAHPVAPLAIKHNNAGVDLFNAGKFQQAIEQYSRAIVADPRYAEAYSNRGAAYDALNDSQRAVENYTRAIQLQPALTAAYSNRAAALGDLGKYSQAIADWQVVLQRQPHSTVAYMGRGLCYKNLKDLKAALADYRQALRYSPHNRRALAASQALKPMLDGARQTVHDLPAAAPAASIIPNAVPAKPAPATGQPALPRVAFAPSQPMAPSAVSPLKAGSDAVHQLLGGLCLMFGQYQAAAAQYNQAVLDNPGDAFAHLRCGNVYALQGDERAALKEYQAAVERGPHLHEAYVRRERLKRTIVVPAPAESPGGQAP